MIIEIVLVYVVYLALVILGVYYYNLFTEKDQYTRDELKNILPYFSELKKKISDKYHFIPLFSIMVISSFFGVAVPMAFKHWFTNSSIFFVILFFILPLIKRYFEKTQVTQSEEYSDVIANLFIRYIDVMIIGFGAGLGSALIYNWRDLSDIYSLFFLVNILIISIFIGYTLKNILKD